MTELQAEPLGTGVSPADSPENGSADVPDFDLSHMDTFRAPDLETDAGGADAVVQVGEDGAPLDVDAAIEQMSKDSFYVVFKTAFQAPGFLSLDFQPLAIQPGEEPTARQASDAAYELLEIYYPKALMPGGDNFARLMMVGSFMAGKIMLLRMILMHRRAAKMAPPPQAQPEPKAEFKSKRTKAPEPANTDAAPPDTMVDPFAWTQMEQEAA